MREDTKAKREADIVAAAYALLEARGFGGVSMLSIAKAAKASNETLYRWYGDKAGLFLVLVERNAAAARALLEAALEPGQVDSAPLDVLANLGPALLEIVTGPRAIALNRAAAADPTGALGRAIAQGGRETIAPLVAQVVMRADTGQQLGPDEHAAVVASYFNLLIGDLQIRRVIGVLGPLTAEDRQARSARALDQILRLYPALAGQAAQTDAQRG